MGEGDADDDTTGGAGTADDDADVVIGGVGAGDDDVGSGVGADSVVFLGASGVVTTATLDELLLKTSVVVE